MAQRGGGGRRAHRAAARAAGSAQGGTSRKLKARLAIRKLKEHSKSALQPVARKCEAVTGVKKEPKTSGDAAGQVVGRSSALRF